MNITATQPQLECVSLASVPFDALAHFESEAARQDPLFRPLTLVRYSDGFACLTPSGEVLGLAWRQQHGDVTYVDVRVRVQDRRQGIGQQLMALVMPQTGDVFAMCDAGQRSALKFFAHHRFEYSTTIFAYRWDGVLSEVPPTFNHAQIIAVKDPFSTWCREQKARFDSVPRTLRTLSPIEQDEFIGFEAHLNGRRVGEVTAVLGHEDFGVIHWRVDKEFRKRGIGRQLLCALLRAITEKGRGLVIHVDGLTPDVGSSLSTLGFWVYRSWQCFRLREGSK